jgi:surface polysaccharide O-acyltransferase-like enzyme
MLFIVIIIAFILYAGLYMLWVAAQTRLDSSTAILKAISDMLFVPDHLVFMILRSVIFLALFYVVADMFMNSAKRTLKRRREPTQNLKATFNTDNSHIYRDSAE